MTCPFCELGDRILFENDTFVIIDSKFAVTKNGHLLIVPKEHYEDWSKFIETWRCGVDFIDTLQECILILKQRGFTDYNAGFNQGELAGQTVKHIHFHLIGRIKGDVEDPRGGIRNIIPSKGNYLRNS